MSWLRNTSDNVTRGGETSFVFHIAGLIFHIDYLFQQVPPFCWSNHSLVALATNLLWLL